ncbi:MAG: recombinase family protein [Anaerolineae bacterium]|nr:recombinase family protein [Anaerolineae bacterium]
MAASSICSAPGKPAKNVAKFASGPSEANARAKSGKWTGGNAPPYGYRRVGDRQDSHLEIDPQEAVVVQRIFDWCTGGEHGAYATLRAIARQLNAEGIAPPNRHKIGRGWYIFTIKAILNREAYLGKFSFSGIPIELPELCIIEPEVWQAAQAQLRANREQAQRNRRLTGLSKCSRNQ